MKISIVTIGYNNREGMKATLESVAKQEIHPQPFLRKEGSGSWELEHIIVDGGSTDGSVDIIKEYVCRIEERGLRNAKNGLKCEVKWVSEKDKGIYNAMNKGIRMATGDYCLFLNSGDVLAREDVLARVYGEMQQAEADIYYGDVVKVKGRKKRRLRYREKLSFADFVSPYPAMHHQASFIRTNLFEQVEMYREDMYIAADWHFFFQAVMVHKVIKKHMNIVVAICDMSGLSNTMTANDPKRIHDQSIRENVLQQYTRQNNLEYRMPKSNWLGTIGTKIKWRMSPLFPLSMYIR